MSRYFVRFKCWRFFIFLILILLILVYIYSGFHSSKEERIQHDYSSNIRTHDFRLYPQSRSAIEYNRIQIDNIARSMFDYNENKNIIYSQTLNYSETIFRSTSFPIIWLDNQGDVRWNRAAQYETLNYLLEKQFPVKMNISSCLSRQLFFLEQWPMGFFSRHHCFIEHFGQTLYSPSMVLLSPKRFSVSNAANEDFQNEGILRYYQSISLCSSYLNHPELKTLHDQITSIGQVSSDTKVVTNVHQLLERDELTVKYKYSREIWRFGYDHVPHRRWLFDRNRIEIKKILTYHSPIQLLIDHSNEHIYYDNNTSLDLINWRSRNSPQAFPKDVLTGSFDIKSEIIMFFFFFRYNNTINNSRSYI